MTEKFIVETLCAPSSLSNDPEEIIRERLPSLTNSYLVDVEIYAFLAIFVKEYVHSWYKQITSDRNFVTEVVHIVAHCTRELEQRVKDTDIESMLLDEIPFLLSSHLRGMSYR